MGTIVIFCNKITSNIAINEALEFENYYILLKNEIYIKEQSDKKRLSTLITRKWNLKKI